MFEALRALPADPILKLMVQCRNDPNPLKVDLGVGVYKNEQGHTPIMAAVREAEQKMLSSQTSKVYIGPAGSELFNHHIAGLLLGYDHPTIKDNRLVSAQTPGGCGALRVAAELINRSAPSATMWVSDPTWANHVPTFSAAGIITATYPYYDNAAKEIRFDSMLATLEEAKEGDIVLLHGCCHNPCGADLNQQQWQTIADLLLRKNLIPFIDIAYQGLGDGLDEDAYGLRLLANQLPEMIIASSCSKNFGLYRERTGAVMVISASADASKVTASNLMNVIRSNYSMPPAHGASIVETILDDSSLTQMWKQELNDVCVRINDMRARLSQQIAATGCQTDFSFIPKQKGMFSFLGVTPEQVHQLRDDYSIYMVDSSRISIAGLNPHNIDYVAEAISSVVKP
ncbi:aromatic amino acid transaminase [Neptunomonas phycophila]|uniref:amino acid aminotransferase n=1 Tax=Neptunomonas phycophila TaxID=1572645 RepID=UPI0015B83C69|nr:amino acid aminotransferase [Neptunomonas phycophila]QLE97817.1 aspartate/tyrosine/aromatic aminotransferase [Neptunomonas phycophila]